MMAILPLLAILTALTGTPTTCTDVLPGHNPNAQLVLGVYDTVNHAIALRTDVCQRLELLRQGKRPESIDVQRDFAQALWVVGHEWAHADGIEDETKADCAGVHRMDWVARALRVRRTYAETLHGYAEAVMHREGCGWIDYR
jgi:hypothetical protein